jgi:LAO/AO transport system kinase
MIEKAAHGALVETDNLQALLSGFERGDKGSLARLITLVENRAPGINHALEKIYSLTGRARVLGITGATGAGKSTLVNRLIAGYRAANRTVAVLAVDPSSPFSGGAVLGDRIRMTEHYRDPGVYIRSLSSRGSHGGVSRAARDIVKLLDGFGFDVVIVETVGVGQTELSVMDLAQTTVVVTVPEGGDSVQVLKAGLNEIADIFVVNKADREGAHRLKAELELGAGLGPSDGWQPPVILTKGLTGEGIDELMSALGQHAAYLKAHRDESRDGDRLQHEFTEIVTEEVGERLSRFLAQGEGSKIAAEVRCGKLNPYRAARELIEDRAMMARMLSAADRF